MDKKFEHVLAKLCGLCERYEIKPILTGTCALDILGVPNSDTFKPKDIDLKVGNLSDDQKELLVTLNYTTGPLQVNDYGSDTKCYTFMLEGIKINIIEDPVYSCPEQLSRTVLSVLIPKPDGSGTYLLPVQKIAYALFDKMKLNREKDLAYLLDLVRNITGYAL